MALKIKRKFLLADDSLLGFLSSIGVRFGEFRVCKFYACGGVFTRMERIGGEISFLLDDAPCSEADFKDAALQASALFYKRIYTFKLNNNPCTIEIYTAELSGLFTLEISFNDDLYGVFFRLPEFLSNYIVREVSATGEASEPFLTHFGNANEHFDVADALYVLKEHDISLNFPRNLRSKDAVCILLFSYLMRINEFKNASNVTENFTKIFTKLDQTYKIFTIFSHLFDGKTAEFFSTNFSRLHAQLVPFFRLFTALELSEQIKGASWMGYFLQQAIATQAADVSQVLQQADFLKDWEIFLADTSDFFRAEGGDVRLAELLSYEIRARCVCICKELALLNERAENDKFFAIFDMLSKLEALFLGFADIFECEKLKTQALKLTQKFRYLCELDALLELVDKVENDDEARKLSEKIYAKIYKARHKILKNGAKFKSTALKRSKELKIYYKKA